MKQTNKLSKVRVCFYGWQQLNRMLLLPIILFAHHAINHWSVSSSILHGIATGIACACNVCTNFKR